MFDAKHPGTFEAINELCSLVAKAEKPCSIWVGAGASAWYGLPLWSGLADKFHYDFGRFEAGYNREQASRFISGGSFPAFFSYCKRLSPTRFNSLLVSALALPEPIPPVYSRFISALKAINQPLHLITTNVDEALEHNLALPVIFPHDLERAKVMIQRRESFVAKIHGSLGSVESTVFTSEEYAAIISDAAYIASLRSVFEATSVIFIGYGLQDAYIIETVNNIDKANPLFGVGPHFAVMASTHQELPPSIRTIRFVPQPHTDHRTSIQVIEELAHYTKPNPHSKKESAPRNQSPLCSAHFLSDIYPAGTWSSSQTLSAKALNSEREIFVVVGHGLTEKELPLTHSTSMHDLVVGLVCFDTIYAPLASLSRLYALTGSTTFAQLVSLNILHFVHLKGNEGICFAAKDSPTGDIGTIELSAFQDGKKELTNYDLIRRQLSATPGHEQEAERIFGLVEKRIVDSQLGKDVVPPLVRSLLHRPSVRAMLGVSDAVNVTSIPRWVMFPILRLAQVVRVGMASSNLGVASVKFEFGNDQLAGPAFAAALGNEHADALASYVVAGNFSTNLGAFVQNHPEIIVAILKFRESEAGIQLRKDILSHLKTSAGSEVAASINAGLSHVLPTRVMDNARAHFARLCVAQPANVYPGVWFDAGYGDKALSLWRQASRAQFAEICKSRRLSTYDQCPCGSGEKIKFCCGAALGWSGT